MKLHSVVDSGDAQFIRYKQTQEFCCNFSTVTLDNENPFIVVNDQ